MLFQFRNNLEVELGAVAAHIHIIGWLLLVGQQEGHAASKKLEWCGAGVVVCLE